MRLVLLDKDGCVPALCTGNSPRFSIPGGKIPTRHYKWEGEVEIRPDLTNSQCTPDVANRLIAKIMENHQHGVALTVELMDLGDDNAYGVVVNCSSNFNILKELKKRFKDKVKIIVSIKFRDSENGIADNLGDLTLYTPGMIIDNDESYPCKNGIRINVDIAEARKVIDSSKRWHVRITADIPEEELVAMSNEISHSSFTNRAILEEGLGSDLVITAANGVKIRCHKSFLMTSSPVFRRILSPQVCELDMTIISEEGVKAFLRYFYYHDGIASKEKIELVYELLYASRVFEVQGLEELVTKHLMKRECEDFSPRFAFQFYCFVRNMESAWIVKNKMIHILQMKFDELKTLPEFREFFRRNIDNAIQLCEDFAKAGWRMKFPSAHDLDSAMEQN